MSDGTGFAVDPGELRGAAAAIAAAGEDVQDAAGELAAALRALAAAIRGPASDAPAPAAEALAAAWEAEGARWRREAGRLAGALADTATSRVDADAALAGLLAREVR